MSIKKDANGRRYVEAEVEVHGTPEQVWEAIATGQGVSSWFVPTEIRDDGSVVSHFGPGMDAVARQTSWEPPHRFAAEGEMQPGAPKLATEWIVEAKSGGTCIVRVVHSMFTDRDDWDDQLEGIEKGWPTFFEILRRYLIHYSGQPCAPFQHMGMGHGTAAETWNALAEKLGVKGVVLGQHISLAPSVPALAGIVELVGDEGHNHQVLLRLDAPGPGLAHIYAIAMGPAVFIAMRFFYYGDDAYAIASSEEPRWQAWLQEHFPMTM